MLSSYCFMVQTVALSDFYTQYYATFHILSTLPGTPPLLEFTRLSRKHLVLASKCWTQTVILFLHRETLKCQLPAPTRHCKGHFPHPDGPIRSSLG